MAAVHGSPKPPEGNYHLPQPTMPPANDRSLPLEQKDSASPALYFKTLAKVISFVKIFFVYVAKKTFKIFNSLPGRILDFLVLRFPKMSNFRNTLRKNIDPNVIDCQKSDKSKRHADNLQERLKILTDLLETDVIAPQNGEITQFTHLTRYLQIVAMKLAYCLDANPFQRIPLPHPYFNNALDFYDDRNSYTITLKIDDKGLGGNKGLFAYGLEPPEGSSAPPLLLIKGTSTTNLRQISDDLSDKIGSKSLKANKARIKRWIEEHDGTIVSGHSLGGAIAQIIGRKYHAHIKTVVTFASPSPGKKEVAKFTKKQREGKKTPEVFHFINKGDIASSIGGFSSIPGHILETEIPDTLTPKDKLSRPYTITLKDRHSWPFILTPQKRRNYIEFSTLQITDQIFLEEKKIKNRRFLRIALEICRWTFSFFLSWAVRLLAKKQNRTESKSVEMEDLSLRPRSRPPPSERRYSMY